MKESYIIFAIIAIFAFSSLAFILGGAIATKEHRDMAIANGCAQYNSQTGDFEWKKESE